MVPSLLPKDSRWGDARECWEECRIQDLQPRSHQPLQTSSPAHCTTKGLCPKCHIDIRWGEVYQMGPKYQIKAVISLTWNCIGITPASGGCGLQQILKKTKPSTASIPCPDDFTEIPYGLCESTWKLIIFIPLPPAFITMSHVSQRQTAVQTLIRILHIPFFCSSPFLYFYQRQEHQLPRWPSNYREKKLRHYLKYF